VIDVRLASVHCGEGGSVNDDVWPSAPDDIPDGPIIGYVEHRSVYGYDFVTRG
jgi:hypothetical protein